MSSPVDVAKRWAVDNLRLTDLTVAFQEKHSTWTVLTFECPGVDPADMPFFVVTDDGDVHLESVPLGHWFDV